MDMPGWRACLIFTICLLAARNCHTSEDDTCPGTYQTETGFTCFKCSRGFRKVADCLKSGQQARCEPCGLNWYQPRCTDSPLCIRCRPQCPDRRQFLLENCTRYSDIQCRCKAGHFFQRDQFSSNENDGVCLAHRNCSAGFGLRAKGDHEKDSECEPCEDGVTFSNVTSQDPCVKCTVCVHATRSCTPSQDSECGSPQDEEKDTPESGMPWWAYLIIGVGSFVILANMTVLCVVCRRAYRRCPACAQRKAYELEHGGVVEHGAEYTEHIEMEPVNHATPLSPRPDNEDGGIDNPAAEDAAANGHCNVDELAEEQHLDSRDTRQARDFDGQHNGPLASDVSNRRAAVTAGESVHEPRGTGRDMREIVQPTGADPCSQDYSLPSIAHSSGNRSNVSTGMERHGRQDIGPDRSRETSVEIHMDPSSRLQNQTVPIGPADKQRHDEQTAEAVGAWSETQHEPVYGQRDSTLPSPSSSLSTLPSPRSSLSSTRHGGKGDLLGGIKHSGQGEHGVRGEMSQPSFEREPPTGSSTPSNSTPANQVVRPVMPVRPVVVGDQRMEELKESPVAHPIGSLTTEPHDLHPAEDEGRANESPEIDNTQVEDESLQAVVNEESEDTQPNEPK